MTKCNHNQYRDNITIVLIRSRQEKREGIKLSSIDKVLNIDDRTLHVLSVLSIVGGLLLC